MATKDNSTTQPDDTDCRPIREVALAPDPRGTGPFIELSAYVVEWPPRAWLEALRP